jgi:hypothetical protein
MKTWSGIMSLEIDRDALDRWIMRDPRDRDYANCYCGCPIDEHDIGGCTVCSCNGFDEDAEDDYDWDSYNDAREEWADEEY